MRKFQLLLSCLLMLLILSPSANVVLCQDNNILWDQLYHNDPNNYDPTTEFVPFESYTFRDVDPSGKVYPTTSVNIYIMVNQFDLTSANVVYSTGGSDTYVPMSWVKNITVAFHGQPLRTYDLWFGTIPAQPALTTVYYRIQVNDGSASAYLKWANSAGGAYRNPLGQWVRHPDAAATDNYSYTVEELIPVELTEFSATPMNGVVVLNWTTQTETENYGFHIYRSLVPDSDYTKITSAIIPGAGTSEVVHHYSYIDSTVDPVKIYYYKLAAINFNNGVDFHGPVSTLQTGMPGRYSRVPAVCSLAQNYPNPFNPITAIRFTLTETSPVTLKIYNLRGQLVRTLVDQPMTAGLHSVLWRATDDCGIEVAGGVYLCTLKLNGFAETRKLLLTK